MVHCIVCEAVNGIMTFCKKFDEWTSLVGLN